MSRRTLQSLKPFPFEADFRPPACDAEPDPSTVVMTASEFAHLAATLRAEGAATAQARLDEAAVSRLEAAAGVLARATERLAGVADLMDKAGGPAPVAGMVRLAAQDIADGQGDLFAALDAFAPPGARPAQGPS